MLLCQRLVYFKFFKNVNRFSFSENLSKFQFWQANKIKPCDWCELSHKEHFHTLVSRFLSQSVYLYLTVVYYILLPWAQTTPLQSWTKSGPKWPHGVLSQFFFGVNLLLYIYKLFCYRVFGHKSTALEPASYKALKVPVK